MSTYLIINNKGDENWAKLPENHNKMCPCPLASMTQNKNLYKEQCHAVDAENNNVA